MKHLTKFNETSVSSAELLQKIVVYYGCFSGGDGSVHLTWYLDQETASEEEESQDEGWGEDCTGSVETFAGSDIHKKAIVNDERAKNSPDRKLIGEMKLVPTDEIEIENWLEKYFKTFDDSKQGKNAIRQQKDYAADRLVRLCGGVRKLESPSTWRIAIKAFRNYF